MFAAVCVMVMMISCKNKSQTTSANRTDSVAVVIDSIIEENDTTPLPMFLIGGDGKYMHMLYWANIEETQKTEDNAEYFDVWRRVWEQQEMFRRNAAQYTNLLTANGIVKVRFVDEVLKDPDGNTPSIGEIHGREEIPALCARFEYVNPKDNDSVEQEWGMVIATDSYLKSRKRLEVKSLRTEDYNYPELPADVVKKLEEQYGMKAERSYKTYTIGDRYTMGAIEFKGEYQKATKEKYAPDRKCALALELLRDGESSCKLEILG